MVLFMMLSSVQGGIARNPKAWRSAGFKGRRRPAAASGAHGDAPPLKIRTA
jgi:hypothetical protein